MEENKTASARISITLIRGYQFLISPLLGPRCRYSPSCSEYAKQAIATYGLIAGTWIACKRLLRCHPLSKSSGWDPVPIERKRR